MSACDLCDKRTRYLSKQMIGVKCIIQTCEDCNDAVVEQEEKFEAERLAKIERIDDV